MYILALAVSIVLLVLCLFPGPRAWISRVARALWVCRASAISVGLGFLLFAYTAPARDLFVEDDGGYFYWTVFFVLVLAWALCAHFAARKALEQQAWAAGDNPLPLADAIRKPLQKQYAAIGAWLPRVLGLICFIAVGFGIAGAEKTSILMQDTTSDEVSWYFSELQVANLLTAMVYLLIVLLRRVYQGGPLDVLLKGDPKAVISESNPVWFLQFLTSSQHRAARASANADWIAIAIVGAVTLCFFAATFFPLAFGYVVPRAWFVPVMLGVPLFPLAILTAFSHRLRFPLLLVLLLALGGLTTLAPAYHNARMMRAAANGTAPKQADLEHALSRWGQLNCPAGGSGGSSCRPVIVALAGGASRASFLSATVLGDILDTTRNDQTFRDFGTQMFAISGVSGGAVGAIMIRTALVDSGSNVEAPCRSTDGRWYAFGRAANRFFTQNGAEPSWKACLQSIAAGDFLSPVILGLAFRDPWGGLIGCVKGLGGDRAALLEEAFEARYARSLEDPQSFFSRVGALIGADRELALQHGLARPLGYVGEGERWTPLLLLNTTSVDSGRRLIASELAPMYRDAKGHDRRLFPEAYDLFEELPPTGERDIPLSTAATLSARFPLISPYGALQGKDAKHPSERLVDGGYFENDGVTTAFELVLAIKQLRPKWEPVVVHVTNDPVRRAGLNVSDGETPPLYGPSPPPPRVSEWFESLLNPVTALFGTRGGHAAQAVEAVLEEQGVKYARFQVFDEAPPEAQGRGYCHLKDSSSAPAKKKVPTDDDKRIDEVSLSWWLSGAVQKYLDRQLCHQSNRDAWDKLSGWLKKT
jgi:hypothetical protein